MDRIRLVAIGEPAAGARAAVRAVPVDARRPGVPTPAGPGALTEEPIANGPGSVSATGSRVLDHVLASRLDRSGAPLRWGIGAGRDDASARTRAQHALRGARERGNEVGFATGDPWRDALLADLGVALAALLDDLTTRQAEIAGLVLVDGARQAEVAMMLGVSRATVSVAVARGRLRAIAGVRRAIEELLVGPSPTVSRRSPAAASPAPAG